MSWEGLWEKREHSKLGLLWHGVHKVTASLQRSVDRNPGGLDFRWGKNYVFIFTN